MELAMLIYNDNTHFFLCLGSSWLGVNDSAQFALPVCRVIGIANLMCRP